MRYEEPLFRPPSEAESLILQATVGCSWNHCAYCAMYRGKTYRVRPLEELLAEVRHAGRAWGPEVTRLFVADGDALAMGMEHWEPLLLACREAFPRLRRVSAYATALNLAAKGDAELRRLRELGLSLLYVGPETGDEVTFRRIAKGAGFAEHAVAARRAHAAGMKLSVIFLLGAGGTDRSREHAEGSARLATEMDPEYLSLLTLTVVPGTPIAALAARGEFALPSIEGMLGELRTIVGESRPSAAVFRTNHASNYLALEGRLPRDRERIVATVDSALAGGVPLRPEWARGL
ncbi:MAG TPA: radical SAM protein [Anaeromyxobacteraceae bacterium]|nr:radical SAM protein [Anaeromyxobacteraceae bacterium]